MEDGGDEKVFVRSLTDLARAGLLEVPFEREEETARLIAALARRTKSNALLLGETGLSKRTIVASLARKIARGDVPGVLVGCEVLELDMAAVLEGWPEETRRAELKLTQALQESKDGCILFVDEIHLLMAATRSNILKLALARGLRCVGSTSVGELACSLDTDKTFLVSFQKIAVDEPSDEKTAAILRHLQHSQGMSGIKIEDDAIDTAVRLAKRNVSHQKLPDSAIDLVNEACLLARIQDEDALGKMKDIRRTLKTLQLELAQAKLDGHLERSIELRFMVIPRIESELLNHAETFKSNLRTKVDCEDIFNVVSISKGVPTEQLKQIEEQDVAKLSSSLAARVKGQALAIEALSNRISRSHACLAPLTQPVTSFFLCGLTGSGRTALAEALSTEVLSGTVLQLDMNEFQEKESVRRLIGSPIDRFMRFPDGELSSALRRSPDTVVVLDQVEMASCEVLNLLARSCRSGFLLDGRGTPIDIRSTIFMFKSNLGSQHLDSEPAEEPHEKDSRKAKVLQQIQEFFPRDLLEIVDDVIVLEPLKHADLCAIAQQQLDAIAKTCSITATKSALQFVVEAALCEPNSGAKPLKHFIEKTIGREIRVLLLGGKIPHRSQVRVLLRSETPAVDKLHSYEGKLFRYEIL